MKKTLIIVFLKERKEDLILCKCGKRTIETWIKILENNFTRTRILDMPKVARCIIDNFSPLMHAYEQFNYKYRVQDLAHEQTWEQRFVYTPDSEAVRGLKQKMKVVQEEFKKLKDKVDIVKEKVSAEK